MKKVLFATTALVLTAGIAAAEVTVSGNARMGIKSDFADATTATDASDFDESALHFTQRIRIIFTAAGETDGGLAFGATVRADNAVDGTVGDAGSVYISGAFGKLSMGDVDGAANAAVGHVSGVGLTGLSDLNEMTYIATGSGASDPTARYDYSAGDFSVHASVTNPGAVDLVNGGTYTAYSVAVAYSMGDYKVALGYEDDDQGTDHVILGGSATFGAATVKATYGKASGVIDGDQWAMSVDGTFGATTVTAFYADKTGIGASEAYGLGAAYDLGGGASLVGGYVSNETDGTDAYDFGISFSF